MWWCANLLSNLWVVHHVVKKYIIVYNSIITDNYFFGYIKIVIIWKKDISSKKKQYIVKSLCDGNIIVETEKSWFEVIEQWK